MSEQPTVLIVEPDDSYRQSLVKAFKAAGYSVQAVRDAASALATRRRGESDVVILAATLPDTSGYQLCRQIRNQSLVPILMLGERRETAEIVYGLESGADDYVVKPVESAQIVARANAQRRRMAALCPQPGRQPIEINGLRIDPTLRRVMVQEREVKLTPTEFDLLYLLATNPGTAFQRQVLFHRVWNCSHYGNTNLIDVCVRRLRQKIERQPSEPEHIKTVRGLGYVFCNN